jgi:hypothetical protein
MANAISPLIIIPTLCAVAIKYRQKDFIADRVLPRVMVDSQEFIYAKDRMADWITPVETFVGRTGAVNELMNSQQDPTYLATRDQGLDESVPNRDAKNGPNESALMRATQRVMSLVELRREMRAASILTTSGNFGFSATLSGTSQWSDRVNSNPLDALLTYLDKPFMRPNKLVMGRDVWTQISQHPKMIEAAYWAGAASGKVTKEQVANLLEVDELIVGNGWYNSAAKGQTVVQTRLWGKFCAGIYQSEADQIDPQGGNSWGFTAQFGERIAGTIVDPNIGLLGGVKVRAGESVREVVPAPEFGFLLSAVVA